MLRNIINNSQKGVDATYKAHAELKRGMAVTKGENGLTSFLSKEGVNGVFFVDKEPIDNSDLRSAYTIRPDYTDAYETVKAGERMVLVPYTKGEVFATDQISGELASGDYITYGTNGLGKKSTDETGYICRGIVNDCGVKNLYKIEVLY